MDVVSHFGLSQDPFRAPEPGSLSGGTLTPEAARAYLAGRVAGAGGPDLFSPSALDILSEAANGDPDLLRRLGGSALFHAAFEGAQRVEDQHARQAAASHGGGVLNDNPPPAASAAASAALAPGPVHILGADTATGAAPADPIAVHRRWWRRTPPIHRLAIIVGLLLLSLPIVGYVIGAVKDSQASGSSYLPEDSIVDEERIEPAEADVMVTASPDTATIAATDARVPAPAHVPAVTEPAPRPRSVSQPEPMLEAPFEAEPEPVPLPEPPPAAESPAPPPELETVPIDPPAAPPVEQGEPTPQGR